MAITYNNLYLDIRQQFLRAGLPDPTLESRELVCCASGKSREELSRDGRLYVPDTVEQQVRRLAQRHLDGEPVAYLIGEWEFYGLPLDISESVLIPRPDTEVLVDRALACIKALDEPRVLDLCAGSGCIGLAIAKNAPGCHAVLGELDEGALRVCRQNIRRSDLTGRVVSLQLDAREKPPAHLGEFDCADGLDFYRDITRLWTAALRVGGRLLFEVGIGQADEVLRIMRSVGFGDLEITPDLNGIPRVVEGVLHKEL